VTNRDTENPPGPTPVELAAGVVAERVGAGWVLVHLETDRIYELRGTGARVFELLREGRSRAEIERLLAEEFAVEPQRLAADLDRHLAELRRVLILK
jgi:hypothetical protein